MFWTSKLIRPALLASGIAFTCSHLPAQSPFAPFTSRVASPQDAPKLWLAMDSAKPGTTFVAAVYLKMPKGWHTYWKYPGDAGQAPDIKWTLPSGVTAEPIQWPTPDKDLATAGTIRLYTYVYRDECALLVPMHLAPNLAAGELKLTAAVSWQQCAESCVQKRGEATATLTISEQDKPSAQAVDIQKWLDRLPRPKPNVEVKATWSSPATDSNRLFTIEMPLRSKAVDFFPSKGAGFTIQGETKFEQNGTGDCLLTKGIEKDGSEWPTKIRGLIVYNPGASGAIGFETELEPKGNGLAASSVPKTGDAPLRSETNQLSLLTTLFFALVGGLILNIMPCVLPVIALKVLGFVRKSQESPERVRQLGLVYGLGVLTSFVVLAGLTIGIQKAGGSAGWGTAFQNLQFRAVMVMLLTLVSLNLFGVFEVSVGGTALTAASELTRKEGAAGAFFNGVLATLLATPCTAPFLSVALAFALTQPPFIIVLTYASIGLGLALPFVVICWHPGFLRFLPKPGDWMVQFKVIMGFPMLATAIWLFWTTAPRFGKTGVLWFGLFLVMLSLCGYIWGEFVQKGARRRGLAVVIILGLFIASYGYAMEDSLNWRHPNQADPAALKWETWDPQLVEKARREGHPVLVDFTADTCLTCQLNKRSSLEIPSTRREIKEINAVTFIGDYTDANTNIQQILERYHRPGVPLVLVYPKDAAKPPIVLPTLLTPGIVAKALAEAAQ